MNHCDVHLKTGYSMSIRLQLKKNQHLFDTVSDLNQEKDLIRTIIYLIVLFTIATK